MTTETVTLLVDDTWKLLSLAAGEFEAEVRGNTDVLFVFAAVKPADDYTYGLPRRSVSHRTVATSVWARSLAGKVAVTCVRTIDPGNVAETMLTAAGLSTGTFAHAVPAGTRVATVTGRIAGDKVEAIHPEDGRLVLAGDGEIVRGLYPMPAGDLDYEIETSHPLAPNSPRRTKVKLNASLGFVYEPLPIVVSDWASLFSIIRPVGYTGPYADVRRLGVAGDPAGGATMTLGYSTVTNLPDYAALDAWAGSAEVVGDLFYDLSGRGAHRRAETPARALPITRLNEIYGMRPVDWDGTMQDPQGPKVWQGTFATPLNRQGFSYFSVVKARTPIGSQTYFEMYSDSFTTAAAKLVALGDSISPDLGTFRTWQQAMRAHMATVALSADAANYRVHLAGVEKNDFVSTAAATNLSTFRSGRSVLNTNYNSGMSCWFEGYMPTSKTAAEMRAITALLTEKFRVQTAGWTKRIVFGRNSLCQGYGSRLNQNGVIQAGLGHPEKAFADFEVYNQAQSGRTLATEAGGQRAWHLDRYNAAQDCYYAIGEPANDWNASAFATTADAVADAQAKFNDLFLPQVAAAKARGFKVLAWTCAWHGGFMADNATKHRHDALMEYSRLVREYGAVASNGVFVIDENAHPGFQDPQNAALYTQVDDIHYTNAGYRNQADLITQQLLRASGARRAANGIDFQLVNGRYVYA